MRLLRALSPSVTSLPKQQWDFPPSLPPIQQPFSLLGSPLALFPLGSGPDDISRWVPELRAHFSIPEHPRQLTSTISIPQGSDRGRRTPTLSQSLSVSPQHTQDQDPIPLHSAFSPAWDGQPKPRGSLSITLLQHCHPFLQHHLFFHPCLDHLPSRPATSTEMGISVPGPSTAQFEVPNALFSAEQYQPTNCP